MAVIIPVYNDWEALAKLLERIHVLGLAKSIKILIVNDCSSERAEIPVFPNLDLHIIHLLRNVGHQRAIAIGLAYLADNKHEEPVIVMDADGEDKPEDLPVLLKAMDENRGKIIFAKRNKRSEGLAFRLFYGVYRTVFRLLTGKVIYFGNFSAIPPSLIRKLSFVSEIWNNYPGGVIRSKLPYASVPLDRGLRLAGKSKMNFVSLVMHGMSAMAVFLDAVAVRLTIFSITLIIMGLSGIGVTLFLKLGLDMATPGWASNLASAFFIIVLQAFFISLFLVFTVLNYRSNKHFIPLFDYKLFIDFIEHKV